MELSGPDDAGVFILAMNDGKDNRLTAAVFERLFESLNIVEAHKGPTALVFTGSGKYFSNGFQMEYLKGVGDNAVLQIHEAFRRFLGLKVPCVAAMNGHAMAGGAMLALAPDFRIMREDRGYFCVNELDLGIAFTQQMCALFEHKVPIRTRSHFVIGGVRYTPTEALKAGLVDELAPESEVLPRAVALAAKLASKGDKKDVFQKVKHSMYPVLDPAAGLKVSQNVAAKL